MSICGFGWHERDKPPSSAELAEAFAPYYLFCIERFGVDRCMFESNFPVDKVSYSYAVMWNAFKRLTAGFSTRERAALFHDTAARCIDCCHRSSHSVGRLDARMDGVTAR